MSNSSSDESEEFESYQPPPDYRAVEFKSSIDIDEIHSDNKELWFFTLPKNFDLGNLPRKFKVSENTVSSNFQVENSKYMMVNGDTSICDQLITLLPSADESLKLGKPFKRHIHVVESMDNLVEQLPKVKKPRITDAYSRVKQHENLQLRFIPIGGQKTTN